MTRRVVPLVLLIALVTSSGLALAAFPPTSPVKTGEIAIVGNPQAVAVDLDDDTAYVVSTTGSGRVTAANPTLTSTASAAAGVQPSSVAVDSDDDTIYVTDRNTPGRLLVFTPALTLARQLPVFREPQGVAVHPIDDSVYVTFPVDDSLSILKGRNLDDSLTVRVGDEPYDVAVNPIDDTIYTANYNGRSVSIISPGGQSVSTVSIGGVGTGVSPLAVAVHPTDDTVYFGGQGQLGLVIASADLTTMSLLPLNGPFAEVQDISISPDGSTIYVATNSNSNGSLALNATNLDDSYLFTIGSGPVGVAATGWGAYFALNGSAQLAVASIPPTVTSVTPNSGPTAGGTSITIVGTEFLAGQTSATIGGIPLLGVTVVNSTTITATTPPGAAGAANITVTVGLGSASLTGAFTYVPPPPPVPSSAPLNVAATAGNASASVSWTAPASSGSFPITHYQVVSSPGGRTCLTAALSCTVAGLSNGTAYTFTVQALNGAGWSVPSAPSNSVTPTAAPKASITITGAREGKRIVVSGSTTGFGIGGLVTPRTSKGGAAYTSGRAVLVSMDGTFAWSRKASTRSTWRVYFTGSDGVRSNTVTIRSN